MSLLSRAHFIIGILCIVHFVTTGMLMAYNCFDIESDDTLVRMMLRSNHLYILLTGLIHLFINFSIKGREISKWAMVGFAILFISTIGIQVSFYIDPIRHLDMPNGLLSRTLTSRSLQGFLAGAVVYLILLQFPKKIRH